MEYLSKKGYTKTESMLRIESSTDRDGRPLLTKADAEPYVRYTRGFGESFDTLFFHISSNL